MKRKLAGGQKKKIWAAICMLLIMMLMAGLMGCGSNSVLKEEQDSIADDEEAEASEDEEKEEADEEEKEVEEEPEEKPLEYVEIISVEDYYGDHTLYDMYAPKGNENEEGFVSYFDHGLSFFASVYNLGTASILPSVLEDYVDGVVEEWQNDDTYSDIEVSGMMENGRDRYRILTATREDYYGTPYEVKAIYYMSIQKNGVGILWNMDMKEMDVDEETDLVIDELARCYELDLDVLKTDGDWTLANEERIKEEEEAKKPPKTILWFNATYAPLTYSNSCDWELVGGMEPSSYNEEFTKALISRDWGVEDRESALETVENLLESGHRAKCRECMEELEELGLLELDEETFMQKLVDSGIEDNLFRYVIAYYLYQDGLDADYIAAWDLCRVNQLYADYYICGYMTYEEAMDASLENSLVLQQMYSSWDDLVNAYLLGYQFWQNDPCLTEDSPTMRRYAACQELYAMEDGPYTLDWDLELEKCW